MSLLREKKKNDITQDRNLKGYRVIIENTGSGLFPFEVLIRHVKGDEPSSWVTVARKNHCRSHAAGLRWARRRVKIDIYKRFVSDRKSRRNEAKQRGIQKRKTKTIIDL
jgi:hypothetical protein